MSPAATPLIRIPVGVVVERRRVSSPWVDFTWRALSVLDGLPDATPWTVLHERNDITHFYGGAAEIELYRSETGHYRANLEASPPGLWIVMSPTDQDPPYRITAVTADPTEGEGLTESAVTLVEQVPMPNSIREIVERFVAEHHVERKFVKRTRDRADPEALSRRGYGDHDE